MTVLIVIIYVVLCACTEPQWMEDYIKFHAAANASSQYLVYKCADFNSGCGGIGDRLRSLMIAFYAAVSLRRVFLIDMRRPINFTYLMTPNRINWWQPNIATQCATQYPVNSSAVEWVKNMGTPLDELKSHNVVCVRFLVNPDQVEELVKNEMFGGIGAIPTRTYVGIAFRALFFPTAVVWGRINDITDAAHLPRITQNTFLQRSSGKWFATHVRDRWTAIVDSNFGKLPSEHVYNHVLVEDTLHCISVVNKMLNWPVYIASDSATAKHYMTSKMKQIRQVAVPIVHFDKELSSDHSWAWAELLILAHAPCIVAASRSGYSLYASFLSESPFGETQYCYVEHANNLSACELAHRHLFKRHLTLPKNLNVTK